jgi:hypothetical protein
MTLDLTLALTLLVILIFLLLLVVMNLRHGFGYNWCLGLDSPSASTLEKTLSFLGQGFESVRGRARWDPSRWFPICEHVLGFEENGTWESVGSILIRFL